MSKAVLISIRPKWCELIASGKKTVEIRKTRPKLETPFKCYIYRTKGKVKHILNGKWFNMPVGGNVIGEFICDTFVIDKTFGHDPLLNGAACMSEAESAAYSCSSPIYGWHISDLVIYDESKELSEFFVLCDRCDKSPIWCEYGYEENTENGYYSECICDFKRPIKRPPQSWCYVEDLGDEIANKEST